MLLAACCCVGSRAGSCLLRRSYDDGLGIVDNALKRCILFIGIDSIT